MVTTNQAFEPGSLISSRPISPAAPSSWIAGAVAPRQAAPTQRVGTDRAGTYQQRGARPTPPPNQWALMELQTTDHAKQAMGLAAQYPRLGDQIHLRKFQDMDLSLRQHDVYALKGDVETAWDHWALRSSSPSFKGLWELEQKAYEEHRHEQWTWTARNRELLAKAAEKFGSFHPVFTKALDIPSGRRTYWVHVLAILAAHDLIDAILPDKSWNRFVLWRYDGETLDEARDRVFPVPVDQDFMAETAQILQAMDQARLAQDQKSRSFKRHAEPVEPVDPVARTREAYEVLAAYAMQEQPILPVFNPEVFNKDMRGAVERWCAADGNLDSLDDQDYEQIRRLFLAYGYPVWGYPVPPEREPPLFDPLSLLMPAAAAAAAEVAEIAEESISSTLEQFPEILPFDDDEE